MSKKAIIGIIIIAVITGLGATAYYITNRAPAAVGVADITVNAAMLIQDFEEDEDAANKKYLGKVIQVDGTVKEVIEQDNAFVILLGEEVTMSNVSCTLSKEEESVAHGLTQGDRLLVKGRCTGFLLDVVLVDCVLPNEQ